ncbi:hypothetical protein FDI40_gp419 [Agrobacterium phage Atu_ph07]|uniref:Uncharacterized protein n=1 Tax=Agrobacterium phage Atu_ph07 TaxID=2024264 RepID=A0A2L0V061_9CAUD|nr:hypothetical protein FDI40_gp419 [Agrobacterium phage Atu_ph07]AUZ95178.1 hypothetical protein [Agrobacterium phage Atu_ph07]
MKLEECVGKTIVEVEKYERMILIKFDDGSEMVISANGTEDHWVEVE